MMEKLGKELGDKIKGKLDSAKEAIKEDRKKELDTLKSEMDEFVKGKLGEDSDFIKNMQKQLDEFEGKVKDIKEKTTKKSLVDLFKDNKEKLDKAKNGEKVELQLKAAGSTILVGDYAGSQAFDGDSAASELRPGVARIPTRQPYLRQLANVFPTSKGLIYYTEQEAVTDNAGGKAEGSASGKSSYKYKENEATLKMFGHYTKISKEALNDYDYIANEVRNELIKYLELEFDRQLGFGDTTSGDYITGLVHVAKDFDASVAGMSNSVKSANKIDVIRAAIAQIMTNHFTPNAVVISPGDAALMDLQKDDNGSYVMPPFTVNGNNIAGVQVVANAGMATGSFLIGQFDRMNIAVNNDIMLQVFDQNEDDAIKGLTTMQATMRAIMYVKENHKKAFVSGTFEDGINQLDSTKSAAGTTKY